MFGLHDLGYKGKIAIVSASHRELKKMGLNIKQLSNLSSDEISDLMRKSSFGFFPASTISVEACAVGLPFASGFYVENQKAIYSGLSRNGACLGLGNLNCDSVLFTEKVSQVIVASQNDEMKKKMMINQRKMIDLKSPKRIELEFLKL